MPHYFHPRRRKLGVLMLVLALLLMGGWVRSETFADRIEWSEDYIGFMQNGLQSTRGRLIASISLPLTFDEESLIWFVDQPEAGYHKSPRWSWLGFTYFEWTHGDDTFRKYTIRRFVIPYWSIVVPLTLLSAYLLLSKRRVAKPATKSP